MSKKALILGGVPGSGNIGDHIARELDGYGWIADQNECLGPDFGRVRGQGSDSDSLRAYGYKGGDGPDRHRGYEVPEFLTFSLGDYDALIVTLGRTYKDHFTELPSFVMDGVMRANLLFPLEAARRFVQAAEGVTPGSLSDYRAQAEKRALEGRGSNKKRSIIFIGSYAHRHPFSNGTIYCAAKAGLDMAAQTLGWELTDHGYAVHIVHPYHVNGTPMWSQVERDVMASKGMTYEEADAYNRKDLRMPDLLTAQEVGEIVATILNTPSMRWLSGTRVELNGGSR